MAKVYNTRSFRAKLKEAFDKSESGTKVVIENGPRAFQLKCIRKRIKSDE